MDKIIFIGVFSASHVHEQLVSLCRFNGTVTNNGGLWMKLAVSLVSLELDWQKSTSMTNCRERNIIISNSALCDKFMRQSRI
jgi:hypothetical protein